MARPPLPVELAAGPFTVARARAAGLRACDLRGRGLHRPTHAVRVLAEPFTVGDRAAAWSAGLPADAVFSHRTAAVLLGLPLPAPLESDPVLDVMRPSDRTPTRRRGCRGHRGLETRRVVLVDGLRVTSPEDTWCDLGDLVGHGLDVDDLVVVADAVLARSGRDAIGTLRATLDARVRPRGASALAQALGLARPGVRSPRESRARLMFVRAGFPEPEVNAVVTDRAGGWLLEGDLVWREQRVVGEYQGAVHASRRRRSADAHRSGLARDEGWTLLELWSEDLDAGPRRRTTLLRFARALGLDPRVLHLG
ncbi:hypothetical protein [Phycicoccus sonneratiae]|uniref:Transcriptional regulator, AbiEi antitoxin, Type IV TA system n=1 Tax=Phycicoccus sonneratiae TaxID=2807628 RepID=A0ABS2CRE4_9MICO|nr:hypothetical protein [Phycicoccus sonneraticus]MBM6402405.1 hypothetical protein [Phycicoccus sonneraticus]